MQQFEKAAAVCMAILLLGSGSVALAGNFNLGQLIRERFHDEVSADKIDHEEYQSLGESISNEDMTVRCIGAVGDEETSFLMLELEIRNEAIAGLKEISLGIKTYDATVDQEEYGETKCRADKVEAGEDTSRYVLMYQIPPVWAQFSIRENQEILVDIHTLILDYGEAEECHTLRDMVMPITLSGTFMEPCEIISIDQQVDINGRKVMITEIKLSKYGTEVWIAFHADNFWDAQSYWKSISCDYLLGENCEWIPDPNHIELYHNGECVEYAEGYMASVPVHEDGFSSFSGPGEYKCLVKLKAVNLADGDSLEIRYDDVIINVK